MYGNGFILPYLAKRQRRQAFDDNMSFIEQCEWLKNNEPEFAPHSGKDENGNTVFPDFGEWFDNNINNLITQT